MNKSYRSVDYNDERKWKMKHPFDDVLQVGIQKALGYVCCLDYNIEDFKNLVFDMMNTDKLVMLLKTPVSHYQQPIPMLYVGDVSMIQSIIDKNKEILNKSGWEARAEQVFYNICCSNVDHDFDPELYHVIADLFNSWCLWCERSIRKDINGEIIFLSENPYDPNPSDISIANTKLHILNLDELKNQNIEWINNIKDFYDAVK